MLRNPLRGAEETLFLASPGAEVNRMRWLSELAFD